MTAGSMAASQLFESPSRPMQCEVKEVAVDEATAMQRRVSDHGFVV